MRSMHYEEMDEYEMIDAIKAWAESNEDFDISFIESVEDFYHKAGEITYAQKAAIRNIFKKWKVGEFYRS